MIWVHGLFPSAREHLEAGVTLHGDWAPGLWQAAFTGAVG